MLAVKMEEAFAHHCEELSKVDTVGGAGGAPWAGSEESVEELWGGCLAWCELCLPLFSDASAVQRKGRCEG